jgi:hypothetical protein
MVGDRLNGTHRHWLIHKMVGKPTLADGAECVKVNGTLSKADHHQHDDESSNERRYHPEHGAFP